MANSIGDIFKITVFGESHGPAIGVVIEGVPRGIHIDMDSLGALMERRAPGRNRYSTPRHEADKVEWLAGVKDLTTEGTPITAIIRNNDTQSSDYDELRHIPRPGHADYTAMVKYGPYRDHRGGGQFSGRLTAPICIAGGLALQILKDMGIGIEARVSEIAGETDEERMKEAIDAARSDGDSVGGIVECIISGVPAGIGEPMFDGMENRIAQAVFGIPAVKGIEFGAGFRAAGMRGSEHNDPFIYKDGRVVTATNHAGGILGGITDGMPIVFRVALKPTPSIAMEQASIDMESGKEVKLSVRGRHDPTIVLRAVPVVEAAAAIALYDEILLDASSRRSGGYDSDQGE